MNGSDLRRAARSLPRFVRKLAPLTLLLATAGASRAQGFRIWDFNGTSPSTSPLNASAFGSRVAGVGDVDLDGVPDVLVGVPGEDPGGVTDAGEARLFSGATGSLIATFAGAGPNDYFGTDVAGVGDVNGDGVPDLVVAAREAAPGTGYAVVLAGGTGALVFATSGAAPGGGFGFQVAGAGDVNADGTPDVLIAVLGPPLDGIYDVLAFSGLNGGLLFAVTSTFGAPGGIAGPGDLDGDGFADILVGSYTAGPLGAGEVAAFSGPAGAPLYVVSGAGFADGFGFSVAGIGDVDTDGNADFVVGAPGQAGNCTFAFCPVGYARVFSGAGGALLFPIAPAVGGQGLGFGWAVAGVGDLDADDVPDVLVGTHASPPYFIAPTFASIHSGADGSFLYQLDEQVVGDQFGVEVAAVGDVTADGIPEVAVGAPDASPGGLNQVGQVSVFSVAGIPNGSALAGTGCAGSGGSVPIVQTAGGDPSPGNAAFRLVLSRALGGSPALLILGSNPISLNLGFAGMPACTLLASPDAILAASTSSAGPGSGVEFLDVPVPPIPGLVGALVQAQWYVVDPGPAPLPGAMSQRLQIQIVP